MPGVQVRLYQSYLAWVGGDGWRWVSCPGGGCRGDRRVVVSYHGRDRDRVQASDGEFLLVIILHAPDAPPFIYIQPFQVPNLRTGIPAYQPFLIVSCSPRHSVAFVS